MQICIYKCMHAGHMHERMAYKQVAQLSQRDRAEGWVSYGQKWKTGSGRQCLRT